MGLLSCGAGGTSPPHPGGLDHLPREAGREAPRGLMGRSCTICSHTDRDAIEDAFIAGTPKRRIASHYGVSERAVRHHIREHLPALLALARDAERAARADTLLDRVEALQARTLAILEASEETREHGTALSA